MGMSNAKPYYGMTDIMLLEYEDLTYLTRSEITSLLKTFALIEPQLFENNFHHRIEFRKIMLHFPQIENNPFRDRIYKAFSSRRDSCFSFEDLLDFCSVMSESCPDKVKAAWAFKIFDFDEDNAVGENDLMLLIDRLTAGLDTNSTNIIDIKSKEKITSVLLEELDIESSGKISELAFEHGVGKMSEFSHTFSFRS